MLAHRDWTWGWDSETKNRSALPPDHVQRMQGRLIAVTQQLGDLLTLPFLRARHLMTSPGRKESVHARTASGTIEAELMLSMEDLSHLCEEMKAAGMPSNEASRIRQYATHLLVGLEDLKGIKQYRTPLGLRCFARLFIQLIPIMWGPYWAHMAGVGRKMVNDNLDALAAAAAAAAANNASTINNATNGGPLVRCAFFDRILHSRMALVPTPVRLK
jgi:hypothetical protein